MPEEFAIIKMLIRAEIIRQKRRGVGLNFYQLVVKELVKYYGSQIKVARRLKEMGFTGEENSIRTRISKYENGKIMPNMESARILEELYHQVIKDDPIFETIERIMNDQELKKS
jgi:ribosome-binding protein aMBF1 (putative translation factor)